MSNFTFRPAKREQIRLLLAVSGGTGSGKSWSGLLLAKGLANGKRFAAIDTENGRLSMYADFFNFDVVNLHAPFTPARYAEAIIAAEKAGYEVILVDSGSHEWDGDGGVLDLQVEELDSLVERSKKGGDTRPDWQIEEAQRMRSWIYPKTEHKKMMTKLLQVNAHIIMCLRAAERIEIVKDKGKTVVRPKQSLTGLDGWIPICEAKLPFEFTASFLLMAERPGVPLPIKLQEQHKKFFPLDKPITEEAGRLIGEWAKGGQVSNSVPRGPESAPATSASGRGDVRGADTNSPAPPERSGGPAGDKGTAGPQGAGDAPTFEAKPELVAKKWFIRIEKAPTLEMLNEVGHLIKDAPLSEDDKQTARQLYAARKKQLTAAPKQEIIKETAEPWI